MMCTIFYDPVVVDIKNKAQIKQMKTLRFATLIDRKRFEILNSDRK